MLPKQQVLGKQHGARRQHRNQELGQFADDAKHDLTIAKFAGAQQGADYGSGEDALRTALDVNHGNQRAAAKMLKYPRSSFRRLLERHGLAEPSRQRKQPRSSAQRSLFEETDSFDSAA